MNRRILGTAPKQASLLVARHCTTGSSSQCRSTFLTCTAAPAGTCHASQPAVALRQCRQVIALGHRGMASTAVVRWPDYLSRARSPATLTSHSLVRPQSKAASSSAGAAGQQVGSSLATRQCQQHRMQPAEHTAAGMQAQVVYIQLLTDTSTPDGSDTVWLPIS